MVAILEHFCVPSEVDFQVVKIPLVVRHLDPHEFFRCLSKKKKIIIMREGGRGWCFPFHAQPLKLHPSFLVSFVLLCGAVVAPFDTALVILLIPDSTEDPHSRAFVLQSPFLLPGWGSSLANCNTPTPHHPPRPCFLSSLAFTFPSSALRVQKTIEDLTNLGEPPV